MSKFERRINRTRRRILCAVPAIATAYTVLRADGAPAVEAFSNELAKLEDDSGGRLGVCALDTLDGSVAGHRLDERFGMCSTFKLSLAGAILREVDSGQLDMDQFIPVGEEDMVPHAPATGKALDRGGMTVGELAEAAQKFSDNPAANLLLGLIGGPPGFTEFFRSIGDMETRLDRYEPELNFVPHGEVRDTTTPRAMSQTVAKLVTGRVLELDSRELLRSWMEATSTGKNRLRAGMPEHWRSGDKTGTGIATGMANKYNDVAVAWPDRSQSLIVSCYFEADGEYDEIRAVDEAVHRDVGRLSASWIMR